MRALGFIFIFSAIAVFQAEGKALQNGVTIDIPEKQLVEIMKTNVESIFLAKDGLRGYSHSRIRDGALTSAALLGIGINEPVKEWLDAVTSNGDVERDARGEYVFAVRNYIDYSGDKEYLPKVYPKVVKVLEFSRDLRRRNMTDEFKNDPKKMPYYGIFPAPDSHAPETHRYLDDFFALRGFKDGAYLANLMEDTVNAEWMRKEADDLRKCIYDSIKKVAERDKLNYIPGCVEKGDFDPASIAAAIVVAGELEYMPKDLLKNTFDRHFTEFGKAAIPGREKTFVPYEIYSANAYFRMDQRNRGLTVLRYFAKYSAGEEGRDRVSDTPAGAGYIDAVRTMFVYEDDGKLILGEGLAPEWFDRGIEVKDMPTLYGKICYVIKKERDVIRYFIYGNAKPPKGVKFVLPKELKNCKIEEMKTK